jgi:hypothetical protein
MRARVIFLYVFQRWVGYFLPTIIIARGGQRFGARDIAPKSSTKQA